MTGLTAGAGRRRSSWGSASRCAGCPRLAGERESVCPWCGKDTLRQLAQQGVIFCCDVSCTDEEGRRPRAQLEMFKGEFVLRWMDGILGTP